MVKVLLCEVILGYSIACLDFSGTLWSISVKPTHASGTVARAVSAGEGRKCLIEWDIEDLVTYPIINCNTYNSHIHTYM